MDMYSTISAEKRRRAPTKGLVLVIVVAGLTILAMVGIGLLNIAYGARREAVALKADVAAMLAAEAGYEKAVYWMSQQQDILSALQQGVPGTTGSVDFPGSSCVYGINLFTFVGTRPVFQIVCEGHSGVFARNVDVLVVQAISGWDMGLCRVPSGPTETIPVNFTSGEIIDMPISINKQDDNPDMRDIHISGVPRFLEAVAMGESRTTSGGADKYGDVMGLFEGGIYFNQPTTKVTDEDSVQTKVDRFRDSTKAECRFTPVGTAALSNSLPAVQLEFYVDGGIGKVRVTNNCTVRGFHQNQDYKTYDFKITPGSSGTHYERYDIYAYHVVPTSEGTIADQITLAVEDTYVTQSFGGVESEPGGQIFVDGNVVIGGNLALHNNDQVVQGRITVVATGNIWMADSVCVDGSHDAQGRPTLDNTNVLGLLAQGVIKVVDPGLSEIDGTIENTQYAYAPIGRPDNPGASEYIEVSSVGGRGRWGGGDSSTATLEPNPDYYERHLPDPMIVEAAITVGGGGWGAENVQRSIYGNRKEADGYQDDLVVHGSISEAIRGVIGLIGADGFLKIYRMDERLLTGIVPGDIWLRGKYVPAPAGWRDYRPAR